MRDWPIPPFFFCFASKVKDTNVAVMFSHELLMERVGLRNRSVSWELLFFPQHKLYILQLCRGHHNLYIYNSLTI